MQQAMDLDSSYVRPVLLAAEICIHQLGDLDLGLDLLKEAEELAGDDQEELLEVLLLRVEGHLVAGEPAPAKELGEELARIPLEQPPRSLRIGRTLMELGQLDRAREHLLHAAEVPTLLADATYFLALASDFDRDPAAAEELFLKVLELDREADLPPWTVTRGAVDRALAQAMEVMDPQAREGLAQLPRVVSDLPPGELVCDGVDPRAMLFLSARQPPPPPELEPALPPDLTPTRIFIYQRNLERSCFSEEEMAEELSFTLEEEFANIMGDMDDMGHS